MPTKSSLWWSRLVLTQKVHIRRLLSYLVIPYVTVALSTHNQSSTVKSLTKHNIGVPWQHIHIGPAIRQPSPVARWKLFTGCILYGCPKKSASKTPRKFSTTANKAAIDSFGRPYWVWYWTDECGQLDPAHIIRNKKCIKKETKTNKRQRQYVLSARSVKAVQMEPPKGAVGDL